MKRGEGDSLTGWRLLPLRNSPQHPTRSTSLGTATEIINKHFPEAKILGKKVASQKGAQWTVEAKMACVPLGWTLLLLDHGPEGFWQDTKGWLLILSGIKSSLVLRHSKWGQQHRSSVKGKMIIPFCCYNDSLRYTNTYTLMHTNTHRYTHRQHFNRQAGNWLKMRL